MTATPLLLPALVSIYFPKPRAPAASSLKGAVDRDHPVGLVCNSLRMKAAHLKYAVYYPPD